VRITGSRSAEKYILWNFRIHGAGNDHKLAPQSYARRLESWNSTIRAVSRQSALPRQPGDNLSIDCERRREFQKGAQSRVQRLGATYTLAER
jgi:hypothetical protein